MRQALEYIIVRSVVGLLGSLPRPIARALGIAVAMFAYALAGKLRRVGMRNLQIAFPDRDTRRRKRTLRAVFAGMGRQLADFCQFPRYTEENITKLAVYDGFENFENARRLGNGVLVLTGHFGGWEIGSFAHSVYGNPMVMVVRDLDNPKVNALVQRYRMLHGNRTFDKDNFARGILAAMKGGETVGILMDTNMTPPQGVFVPYFGVLACTASGLARMALRTGAAVVPGFTLWDEKLGKYRIRFDPALELVRTGDDEADVLANTAKFNRVFEEYARRYPEQWLWVHRRWKTRPPGEPSLY